MTTLFHAYLKVHSPHGVFEGFLSDAPVSQSEAMALSEQYSDIIHKVDSIGMKVVGNDRSKVVVPGDVIRQSVLVFEIRAVEEPPQTN